MFTAARSALRILRRRATRWLWHQSQGVYRDPHTRRVRYFRLLCARAVVALGDDHDCFACSHDKPRGDGCYECGADYLGRGGVLDDDPAVAAAARAQAEARGEAWAAEEAQANENSPLF